jgi:starch synthase
MALSICLISSEVAPLAKTGGLADVSAALMKFLHASGHDVRLFVPFYSTIDRRNLETHPVEFLQDLPLEVGPHRYRYSVATAHLPGSRGFVYLIDCPTLYSRRRLYTEDPDEHLRFIALTRMALECCQRMGWSPQIVHCNDWHTGFGPLFLKTIYSWDRLFERSKSVLTIHNIGYQGVFSAAAARDLGLGANTFMLHQDDLRAGRINSLKHGILYADAITTVSPTYAQEIRTAQYGMGLEGSLRERSAALVGILNGVDYDEWDPRWDRYIPRNFDVHELAAKALLKREFLARLGLVGAPRKPLAGIVSRLTVQKGIDLLFDTLPPLLARRALNCVVLGSGDARYELFFESLQRQFPGAVTFQRGFSDELSHWVEAASDMFLMPSLYEPCGLNQMYSLRYGTVPVVRRTGGLADSVEPYNPVTRRGTGIVFNDFNVPAMAWALNTALELYADRAEWQQLMRNGMAQDFSWDRQGAEYIALYERLLAS